MEVLIMGDLAGKKTETGRIVRLRGTLHDEPSIRRLGPPPDNAGILIRAGMGWVFGIPVKPALVDPRITRLQPTESFDEVMNALWRELAYQWLHRRGQFSTPSLKGKSGVFQGAGFSTENYSQIEQGFLQQAAGAWSGVDAVQTSLNGAMVSVHLTTGTSCFDPRTGSSCAGAGCRACQEGQG